VAISFSAGPSAVTATVGKLVTVTRASDDDGLEYAGTVWGQSDCELDYNPFQGPTGPKTCFNSRAPSMTPF
jgi:hypothetical protein